MTNPNLQVIDSSVSWADFSARLEANSPLLTMLSPAERVVTMHVRLGLSNKEVAAALGKSPATVKAQVASILRKLGVPTRCRLIAWLHNHAAQSLLS